MASSQGNMVSMVLTRESRRSRNLNFGRALIGSADDRHASWSTRQRKRISDTRSCYLYMVIESSEE
jgi:hypothetical protein